MKQSSNIQAKIKDRRRMVCSAAWSAPSESRMFISSGTDLDHDVGRRQMSPTYRDPDIVLCSGTCASIIDLRHTCGEGSLYFGGYMYKDRLSHSRSSDEQKWFSFQRCCA